MNTLRKKILKSFLSYKLWLILLILTALQTTFGQDMDNKIEARQPDFVYNNSKEFIIALENCIKWIEKDKNIYQNVPREITIAQAIVESDYGTSRFSKVANNLFGIRTWDPKVKQMKPLDLPNARFGVKVYKTKCDSIKDTVRILNNHPAYAEFRKERDRQYKEKITDWETLVPLVAPWSTNEKYGAIILETIIKREL